MDSIIYILRYYHIKYKIIYYGSYSCITVADQDSHNFYGPHWKTMFESFEPFHKYLFEYLEYG